jgi:hypothetical protein
MSFFTGLELIEPGLVTVPEWRPGEADQDYGKRLPLYAAVARKPEG